MGIKTVVRTLAGGAIALSAATAVLLPGGAAAAATPTLTLSNDKGCYVNTWSYAHKNYTEHFAHINVSGKGWTPGDTVALSLAGAASQTKTVAADGTFSASFQAPEPPAALNESTLSYGSASVTATDQGSAAGATATGQTATSKTALFTDREVLLWADQNDNFSGGSEYAFYDRTEFKASGFTPGKKIYAHYLTPAGRAKGDGALLGTAKGPCGLLTTPKKPVILIPKSEQSYGYWTLWFSNKPTYSAATRLYAYPFLMDSPEVD